MGSRRKDDVDKAFTVLEDQAHGVTLDAGDIDKERTIVLEEARLGKGAGEWARKALLPKLFDGSRYAQRLPIGKDDIIRTAPPEALRRFHRDWYRPDLMAVVAVGDIEPTEAERLVQAHFGKLKNPAGAARGRRADPIAVPYPASASRRPPPFTLPESHGKASVPATLPQEGSMEPRIRRFALRRAALAALILPFALGARSQAGTAAPASPPCKDCAALPQVYSIMNLGGDEYWGAYLNTKGQLAAYGALYNRFFDGRRWYDVGSLGGSYTLVEGLNDHGVVIGESTDASQPFGDLFGFTWTVARGIRALPGSSGAVTHAINDRGQVVGRTSASGVSARAVRWEPDRRVTNLGPLPFSLSEAETINGRGESGGYTDLADGSIHASKWTASGTLVDLGTLGNGDIARTMFVNDRGDAAGESGADAFFWSPGTGMIATGGHATEGIGHVIGLGNGGEVVGNTEVPNGMAGYVWTRARGLKLLPAGAVPGTFVWSMNRRNDMVGFIGSDPAAMRAVRWHGLAPPLDLNARLHRPPAGLVLTAGLITNDNGDIVAYSNAGLVLLRPGIHEMDAPVLGPVGGLSNVVHLGDDPALALGFVDSSPTETHAVTLRWDDGCDADAAPPVLRESGGVGQVTFRHRFCRLGDAGVWIRITDSSGHATELLRQTYVDDTAGVTLNGRGTLAPARPGGGRAAPLHFALWVPLDTARGTPVVRLGGPFRFESVQVDAPSRSGARVRVEGTGRLNGRPGYRFLVDVHDDTGQPSPATHVRVRITHTDGGGNDVVDYDNLRPGSPAAGASLTAGTVGTVGTVGTAALARIADGWIQWSH